MRENRKIDFVAKLPLPEKEMQSIFGYRSQNAGFNFEVEFFGTRGFPTGREPLTLLDAIHQAKKVQESVLQANFGHLNCV